MVMALLFLLSCSAIAGPRQSISFAQKSTLQRPSPVLNEPWQPIFFKAIDKRTKIARLPRLKSTALQNDDLEIRVWVGFGLIPLEGFVIKRKGGEWLALHLRSIGPHLSPRDYHRTLTSPRSGWEAFWRQLTSEGLLTLPDSSRLKNEVLTADGESFVVEVRTSRSYRTYRYSNPDLQDWPESGHITKIVKIINAEFDIQRR